jgi:hypothetical protein
MLLQVGFVGGIVAPLWSALAGCFPNLGFAATQAVNAKNFYTEQVAIIQENRSSQKSMKEERIEK